MMRMLFLNAYSLCMFFKCTNIMGRLRRMLFLSFLMTPFVESEDTPAPTNGVIKKDRNNKLCGDRAQPTSTNVLIYKMGWPSRLLFLAPFHISCNPDINRVGNRSYMHYLYHSGWLDNCFAPAKCIFVILQILYSAFLPWKQTSFIFMVTSLGAMWSLHPKTISFKKTIRTLFSFNLENLIKQFLFSKNKSYSTL